MVGPAMWLQILPRRNRRAELDGWSEPCSWSEPCIVSLLGAFDASAQKLAERSRWGTKFWSRSTMGPAMWLQILPCRNRTAELHGWSELCSWIEPCIVYLFGAFHASAQK